MGDSLSATQTEASQPVLCVDLDGTLIHSDVTFESICAFVRQHPLSAWKLPVWLLGGRPYFKRRISQRVKLDPALLPYNDKVVDYVQEQRRCGRRVVLATASDELLVKPIADYIGLFDEIIATSRGPNMSGKNKAAELTRRYGRFAYVGNGPVDFPVWSASTDVLAVCKSESFSMSVRNAFKSPTIFPGRKLGLRGVLHAVRAHQWLKNILLFAPLAMAHKLTNTYLLGLCAVAFLAFSMCASSVYLINDLLDLDADRQHHRKRNRAIASGALGISSAVMLAAAMLVCGFLFAAFLPLGFCAALAIYFVLTFSYTLVLKQLVIVDIIVLALLYTLRLFAGGLASGVPVSNWALGFSMFLFVSLACVKRYSEILTLKRSNKVDVKGRGYRATDLDQISQFGSASGYISVLVLAFYISSKEVVVLYSHPNFLWLMCPIALYWISRVWLLAHRGEMHDDPVVFALTDRTSYVVGALIAVLMFFGI